MADPVRFLGLPPVRPAPEAGPPAVDAAHTVSKPFLAYLEQQVQHVNRLQHEADAQVAAVATGQSNNVHEMMIALDKADVSFRMLTRVRNKVIDAYQEIMRMSV